MQVIKIRQNILIIYMENIMIFQNHYHKALIWAGMGL
jgi:hypothetical protein